MNTEYRWLEFLLLLLRQSSIALLLLLVFAGWGRLILNKYKVKYTSIFEELFFSISLGMVLTVIYISFLSLAGIFYKPLLLLLLGGLIGLYRIKIRDEYVYLFILFLILFPSMFLTFYPPFYWDDTGYHLPVAQSIIEHHRLIFDKLLIYPVFPINGDILIVPGLAFDSITAQMIPWLCLFTICLGCFSQLKKRFDSIWALLIASSLFISNQILIFFSTMCYIDIIVSLFIICTVISLYNFLYEKDTEKLSEKSFSIYSTCLYKRCYFTFLIASKWLYISGVFLGISIGTKYIAIIFWIIITILLMFSKKWKELLIYTLIVIIFACPWYIRNFYYTGNPVWPVLGGGNLWTQADYERQLVDLKYSGAKKTFLNFLKSPLYLSKKYAYHGNALVLNPLIWAGLLLLFYYKKSCDWIFLFIPLMFTLFWFITTNLVRYYIACIPVITVSASLGFTYFLENFKDKKIRIFLLALLLLLNMSFFYSFTYNLLSSRGRIPVNDREREAFLLNSWPSYRTVKIASELKGKTYGLFSDNMVFYGKGKLTGCIYGETRFSDVLDLMDKPVLLYKHLKKLDIENLLIVRQRIDRLYNIKEMDLSPVDRSQFFVKIYEDRYTALYRLKDSE